MLTQPGPPGHQRPGWMSATARVGWFHWHLHLCQASNPLMLMSPDNGWNIPGCLKNISNIKQLIGACARQPRLTPLAKTATQWRCIRGQKDSPSSQAETSLPTRNGAVRQFWAVATFVSNINEKDCDGVGVVRSSLPSLSLSLSAPSPHVYLLKGWMYFPSDIHVRL